MISSVSEIYPAAVISLFSTRDSYCVAWWFWLPCHISNQSWTLASLCNFLSSTSFFNSNSFSVSMLSNAAQSPANIPLLARATCLTTTFSHSISPEVLECLQPKTSCPREELASTLTPCGIIQNMSRATLEGSEYFASISSCWRYQSVISGNKNALLISMGSEW